MALYNFRAPSLPIPTFEYSQKQQDQFQNALRLYFNQLDNFLVQASTPQSGTTSERPTQQLLVGQFYFDTTLGIPIYWNGSFWVNAIGDPLFNVTGVSTVGRVGTVVVTTV